MGRGTIRIPVSEYKRLIAIQARAEALEAYINEQKDSISRDVCGAFLDFEVEKHGED